MRLQTLLQTEFPITCGTAKWFITSVDHFMSLHGTWVRAFVVTLRTAEGFLTGVGFFMIPQNI